ncbi:MAG: peptidyl-prolyl cis-trans isomerase [Armatimonadota bacterium]|nr:peptidyl-prolyl cis-trans isomerase [Armatimonadota bacterium]
MRRTAVAIAAALMLIPAARAQEAGEQPDQPAERILATVDGEEITDRELWWYMEQTAGGKLLDELILRHLLAAEAEGQGVKVGTPEVDEAVAALRAEHGSEDTFEAWLRETGQTMKGLRMQLQQELLIDKLLEQRMGLTEEGIREYYEAHREEFTEPSRVHLMDIVTLSLVEAFEARERLAAGEQFAAVAREMSHDPTAEQGGDRGWITPDDVLNEHVADVVFAMAEGEISDPVDCEDHWHVFWVKEVERGRALSLEEARPQVEERIIKLRGISRELFLTLLRRRAEIDVRWEAHDYLKQVYADLRMIKVVVDGQRLELPTAPVMVAGSRLLVPAKDLLEALGAEVSWNAEAGVLEATRDGTRVTLVRGLPVMGVGDEEIEMKEPPQIREGVLMIAPRAPVQALGGSLLWNRTENTLYVESHPEAEQAPEGAETAG